LHGTPAGTSSNDSTAVELAESTSLRPVLTGEFLGTFLLVLFGTGSVASAVLTGALQGLWQVAVVWGFGVAIAIHCSAALSGAHLNPAVTLAVAIFRRDQFPARLVAPYWLAQLAGAVVAGWVVLMAFGPFLERFESREGLIRGTPGSERAAMIFGEYFPNPAIFGSGPDTYALTSPLQAFAVEAFGTAILMLVIFTLTDPRNPFAPTPGLVPFFIGFTVAILICLFAPITQAGWNPARDFGPRLVAWMAGFGSIAIPGPRNGFWIYIVGPFAGALVGAFIYSRLIAAPLGPKQIMSADTAVGME
jgi:glycerol uptake facilitator protein